MAYLIAGIVLLIAATGYIRLKIAEHIRPSRALAALYCVIAPRKGVALLLLLCLAQLGNFYGWGAKQF